MRWRVVAAALAAVVAAGACDDAGRGGAEPAPPTVATTAPTTAASTTAPTTAPTTTVAPGPQQAVLDTVAVRLQEIALVDQPTAMAVRAGDPALYLAERPGRVRALLDGAPRSEPVIDISGDVSVKGESGLLGLAFSPAGDRLYLHYTNRENDTRVVEYAMAGATADPASRRELLAVDQPAIVHNGGQLAVDAAGMLWIALGDGGDRGAGREVAQRLDSLLGKLLRIDPRPSGDQPYGIPPGNPFAAVDGARPEIWALGLRNPWRFSFDLATGDLWIADVGEHAAEEINLAPAPQLGAGANYGWPRYEGTRRFMGADIDGHATPLHTYPHGSGRCAVTGGYVYRGTAIPDLAGAYLYGDVCDGKLRALSQRDGQVIARRLLTGDVEQFATMGQDAAGEVYAMSLVGQVYRLLPA